MRGASRIALAAAEEQLEQTLAAAGAEPRAVAEQLLQVSRLLAAQGALSRALADPGVDAEARRDLAQAVFGGKVSEPVLALVQTVTAQRWSDTVDLVDGIELLGAQAAFTGAEASGDLDDVEDELFRFARIVDAAPELRETLGDPSVSAEAKQSLLRRLLSDKASPTTLLLVDSVVVSPRGRPVDRALDALATAAASRRRREIALVTTALPLTEDQRTRLAAAVGRALGRDVSLQTRVDDSIGAGVVVRVGEELLDGSVRLRLAEARARLAR